MLLYWTNTAQCNTNSWSEAQITIEWWSKDLIRWWWWEVNCYVVWLYWLLMLKNHLLRANIHVCGFPCSADFQWKFITLTPRFSHGVISSFRTSFSDLKPQIQQIKLLKEKYNIWVHFLSRVRWEDCWSVVYFTLCNYTFYMRFSQRYLNNRIQTLIYSVC